ncbi:hypothetical protein [Eubacterium maltosivorans]|uniref:hypothetical protein n=1 Tax=Eubacterium maltosivorans TaxID=2041044 RepID=UPI00189CE659|nr:hypothetical protein [Eubacterium maltosivorans]
MVIKISKSIFLKFIAILLCLFIAVMPFFQPKKVLANPVIGILGIAAGISVGMAGMHFIDKVIYTPEQLNEINDNFTANLQAAFPDPAEYNKQLTTLQNLDNDIRAGKDIDWSKYSGKALYAVLKGVVDVVWPNSEYQSESNILNNYKYYSSVGNYDLYYFNLKYMGKEFDLPRTMWNVDNYDGTQYRLRYPKTDGGRYQLAELFASVNRITGNVETSGQFYCYLHKDTNELNEATGYFSFTSELGKAVFASLGIASFNQNVANVQNIKSKTANKVKLPTRLPQSVINNINNYIDNSTENLIIAPTVDELPTLPDNYNPNTDELPDIPGYVDVTPDQEPTTDPDPTPTPTPEPTPTPPEYNGDEWVNPIGNFFDGLLKFMKAAFVPTLSLDLSALSNMPENFTDKFPFSLPSDIVSIFGVINADPVAPSFSFTFPLSYVGGEDMDASFNLDAFNDAAAVIRSLLLLVVVVLLAWKTYGLVGGDS